MMRLSEAKLMAKADALAAAIVKTCGHDKEALRRAVAQALLRSLREGDRPPPVRGLL
jgi:hypothetical protein